MSEYISINEIEKENPNFFSNGAKQFFKSRWTDWAIKQGRYAYFLTSEKFDHNTPREHTIRIFNIEKKEFPAIPFDIAEEHSIFKFQRYNTKAEAKKELKQYLALTNIFGEAIALEYFQVKDTHGKKYADEWFSGKYEFEKKALIELLKKAVK